MSDLGTDLSGTTTGYTCPYCRQTSSGAGDSCPSCGAPVDITLRVTAGGWTELPAIADLARIQAGHSSVEISGRTVPIADWVLDAAESVFFPHHMLRWQDPSVELSPLPLARAWTRHRAGLPLVMLSARGPGHIAFSHDSTGEMIALPLQAGAGVDVCENRLVVATEGVGYDWYDSNVWYRASGATKAADTGAGLGLLNLGLQAAGMADGREGRREDRRDRQQEEDEWHYPVGRYVDRFVAGERPGLVTVGAGGAAFIRDLAEGETILVKPPALLFKDTTVAMQLHVEYPTAGAKLWRSWGNRYLWLRLWGPGRVGIESCYTAASDPGTDFRDMSQATQHAW